MLQENESEMNGVLRSLLDEKIEEEWSKLKSVIEREYDNDGIEECQTLLKSLQLRKSLSELFQGQGDRKIRKLYIVGSLFLHKCRHYLKAFNSESVHLVTGITLGGLFFLDTILPFRLKNCSWARASGDERSTHRLMQLLDKFGHPLSGYFHSHPGTGPSATCPSSIDYRMQGIFERGGYPAIGAIFSQDGYVRFFSLNRQFVIQTIGTRIRKEAPNVFKLV
jgi:hypothetical protein